MAAPEFTPKVTAAAFNARARAFLPGLLGVEIVSVERGKVTGRMPIEPRHLAPNGYLHAASVIALADTLCGVATLAHLPEGGESFTTIELKANYFGTLTDGVLLAEATAQHLGRTTQVWDARVNSEGGGKTLALFRCTNLVLYPKG